jgi:hypothetical protein
MRKIEATKTVMRKIEVIKTTTKKTEEMVTKEMEEILLVVDSHLAFGIKKLRVVKQTALFFLY